MTGIETVFTQELSGLDKLKKAGEVYMRCCLDTPDQFLFMSRARAIHTREEESEYHQGIVHYQERMFELFGSAIAQGQADGSIRKDLDVKIATLFLVSASVSLFSELAENRERLEQMLGISMETYMRFSLEMLTGSLRVPKC